jgi:tetratricopeptide (TPR) repeat protein
MNDEDKKIISEIIGPKIIRGEVSLLLGAGFSITNKIDDETLPNGEQLRDKLLKKCNKSAGSRTTLKDAYLLASRTLPDFQKYLENCFTVTDVHDWQKKIFRYPWTRIYSTNIDNVLERSLEISIKTDRVSGEFKFFNYTDEGLVSETIGIIPVVTIHGTCKRLNDGFIFSNLEYAKAANKVLDWHNDLAARIIAGSVIIIGNQLDESDLDVYIARRNETYITNGHTENWIVSPNPDEIKSENWRAAGFQIITATAEDFFIELYNNCKPRTVGEVVLETLPDVRKAALNIKAMTWFKSTFRLAFTEIESAKTQKGLLKHFMTGNDPEWFYIVNNAHASTQRGDDLLKKIAQAMQINSTGIGLLHVIGPSGSGKSTAIKSAILQLVHTYRYTYEFDENQSIEKQLFKNIVDGLTEKSIFVFYSAADYYFAVKEIADRHKDRKNPYCLFILEDRTSVYKKNRRQLNVTGLTPIYYEFGPLTVNDAKNIAQKIEEAGLIFPKFSEKSIEARTGILLDKEKGYGGDLLSALFSLTSHENFEQKIFQDYQSTSDGLARSVLNLTAILHSLNFNTPIDYIAGALGEKPDNVNQCANDDLAGILITPPRTNILKCRHRVIATYYFDNYIAGNGNTGTLIGLLELLSRKFTIEDIKVHPLAYRIYRDIINFDFIYEKYFPKNTRDQDTEKLYHEAQKFFGRDGVFWLHFGRFYRKIGKLSEAIDCFKTGLDFYDSFQTRHSIGMAQLELYIENGEINNYQDGSYTLNNERLGRGTDDPYPTTTLLRLLATISQKYPTNNSAQDLAKECFNFGMKYFRDDEQFSRAAENYLQTKNNYL